MASPRPSARPAPSHRLRSISSLLLRSVEDPATGPFIRAYSLGFAFSALPDLIKLVLTVALSRRAKLSSRLAQSLRRLGRILVRSADPRNLAFAAGLALGGARLVQPLAISALVKAQVIHDRVRRGGRRLVLDGAAMETGGGDAEEKAERATEVERSKAVQAAATFLSSTMAGLLAICVLQSGPAYGAVTVAGAVARPTAYGAVAQASKPQNNRPLYGQSPTLDFTLFLLVRAADSFFRLAYDITGVTSGAYGPLAALLASHADSVMFWLSSWRVMWCWFYLPTRLPPSYNRWILALARMDPALLDILRLIRSGEYVYGKAPSTEVAVLCAGIAGKMGREAGMVNPAGIRRLDCGFVHGRYDGACEVHSAKRWVYALVDALKIYLPVHFVPQVLFNLRALARAPGAVFGHTLMAAGRSSTFLATFVATIYASVCLVRTRIPKLFPGVDPIVWDDGLCAGLGCMLCGLSILIESKRRRREMSLFVTTRALYTLLDDVMPKILAKGRRGEVVGRWLERAVFAVSTGGVVTAAVHRPDLVSGVTRGVLKLALGPWAGSGGVVAPPAGKGKRV